MSEANQLGELLVTRQLLTREQLASALDEQLRTRKSLGRILIDRSSSPSPTSWPRSPPRSGSTSSTWPSSPIDPAAAGLITDGAGPPLPGPPDRRGTTAAWSWPWPTRRTSSPSTTSGPSPAPRSHGRRHPGRHPGGHRQAPPRSTPTSRTSPPRPPSEFEDEEDLAAVQRGGRGRPDRQAGQPADHPGRARTGRRTSTSSRPSGTCVSATASTACCTR